MRLLPLWTAATPVWGEDAEEGSKSVHSLAAMHEAVNSTDKSHNIGSRWRYANAKRPMQPVALQVGGDAVGREKIRQVFSKQCLRYPFVFLLLTSSPSYSRT